ncbi:hypothetical protein EFY79_05250 [Hanamia caeni]|jgi:hypothetical protein|uniref:Uncharacterized protein n=1 Tax=Hanamia caeni TaxID=2294116 RepID=A0A3M9NMP7_9BACT|nr:hypothetical protein [Hanamia caeni]RNI39060.1 hypothetical protein EFY79_05250 [Hanamia caeni]
MNEAAKIQLSKREMELVNNTEWIFTKQLILKKVYQILGNLHHHFKKVVIREKESLPAIWQKPGGKISKGENYRGLPYAILDYPASFSKENILAVRTMFWWGNFFSVSLHISGKHLDKMSNFDEGILFLREKKFWISVHNDQWEHHFEEDNFVEISELSEDEIAKLRSKFFLKIAKKTALTEWNSTFEFLENGFEEIIRFIQISFPACETDL